MKERVEMSIGEAERLSIMMQIDKKILTINKASEELGVSLRQAKRIRKRFLEEGEEGLVSRKRGRPSNRKIPEEKREEIINLLKTRYVNFGPTLASEYLKGREQITVSEETLRKWMTQEGLWKPKRKREGKVYQRRERRSRFGELLQGDGSPDDWFEGRGEKCSLLQFVDDATGTITAARFEPTETTAGYLRLLKSHLKKFGRPLALYVDKHAVFRVNKEELKKGVGITHFGRVLKDLDIGLICAHSPQAKGRVERKNGVLQDRLTKAMRLAGISTIEEANEFLPQFIEEINERFGKNPANPEDAHRALRKQDQLERLFLRKDRRKLSKDLTFQHQGTLYLIQTTTPNRLKHANVEVYWENGKAVEVEYNGTKLVYKKWNEKTYEQPKIMDSKEIASKGWLAKKKLKPSKHHPWR
jgi:transposase